MKFLPYMIVMALIFGLFDYYFLRSWKKFIKSRNYNKWFYISAYIIGSICMILLSYNLIYRTIFGIFNTFQWYSLLISTVWYLPKLFIVPVIIIKDIILFVKNKYKTKIINQGTEPNTLTPTSISRRKLLQSSGWIIAGAPYIIVAKNAIHTTYSLDLKKIHLTFDKPLPSQGFKICQISDIHGGSLLNANMAKKAVKMINQINPDICVITGDFVNFNPSELNIVFDEFKQIKSNYGNYAIFGNHDHYMSDEEHEQLKSIIKNMGFELLINENRTIDVNGAKLQLAGIDDLSFHNKFGDVNIALTGLDPLLPTVLLAHDPSIWDKEIIETNQPIDLMLSGHTHGGQISIGLGIGNISPAKYVYKYYLGLYSKANKYLYVNSGFGTTGPPLRIGVPPEITEITLSGNFTV